MDENAPSTIRLVRLLDANFNRAREAARVLEDAARFLLDDAALSEAAKDLRHRLSSAALGLPVASQFSLHRDTPGDVGTALTTPTEAQRAAPSDVIHSAFGRLSEALRTLEEYAKLLDPAAAAQFKQLRYDAYTLHTRLVRRLRPRTALASIRLCVRITAGLCRGDWHSIAEAALAGGADCLHLCEKSLHDADLLNRGRALAALCHRCNAQFLVDSRPDIAVLAGADGVHLSQDSLPVDAVRRIVGPDLVVGKNTHTVEQALAAVEQGADYLTVAPETLRQIAAQVRIPLFALGDITPHDSCALLKAGAQAISVCQAVIAQPDPKAAVAALKASLVP